MTIATIARYVARRGERDRILELLLPAMRASTAEDGCVYFHVLAPHDEPETIVLVEGWRDEGALAAHRLTPHYRDVIIERVIPLLASRVVMTALSAYEGEIEPELH